jgi:hypothetical protein
MRPYNHRQGSRADFQSGGASLLLTPFDEVPALTISAHVIVYRYQLIPGVQSEREGGHKRAFTNLGEAMLRTTTGPESSHPDGVVRVFQQGERGGM